MTREDVVRENCIKCLTFIAITIIIIMIGNLNTAQGDARILLKMKGFIIT